MSSEKHFVLSLYTRTWVRDSHGLYDYESSQTRNLNAVLADSVIIARKKHEIKTVTAKNEMQPDEEMLIDVKYEKNDRYILENPVEIMMEPSEKNITDLSNKIWYVLKQEENNGNNQQTITNTNDDYYLCKNDIIKLGRVKYALNEIHIPSKENNIDIDLPPNSNSDYNIESINMNSQPVFNFIFQAKQCESINEDENLCKICYGNSNESSNPLVHLCNCQGGIRFAHYFCIKKWMETKLVIKENEKKTVKSFNIKAFNCEICKVPYPFSFRIDNNNERFDLIEIERPENDYIILESLNQVKENSNIKSIHVIQLTDDCITIGRGHESDVRINDISVSRSHAKLQYDKNSGRLLLRDLKSKFGTLVLLKKPLTIKERKIHLQIGRTYIEASLMGMKEFEKLKKEKRTKHHAQQENNNNNNNMNNNNNNDNNNNVDPNSKGNSLAMTGLIQK